MTKKEQIILFYYEEKLNTIVISNKLNVSKQYVSKIIKTDSRYLEEKTTRKQETKRRHNNQKVEYNKKRRNRIKDERLDAALDILHRQASFELSRGKTISNRAFRNWNSSIYKFHNRTKEYRIRDDYKDKISYAVPKKIKWN